MLGNRKVLVDSFCEIKEFTAEFEDDRFYSFLSHQVEYNAIYFISRQTFHQELHTILTLIESHNIVPILANPAEGSSTMLGQIQSLGIMNEVKAGKILIISGGYLEPNIPYLYYENFLPKLLDYKENLKAIEQYRNTWTDQRPYKFLFLNGRGRWHRRELIKRLDHWLDHALWTNLDASHGIPLKFLPCEYEFDFYQNNLNISHTGFAKYDFFNQDWGEIYLKAEAYRDTYFSLVTETVFEYPYSFRTEKIWKPIAMGHPFIVVSSAGFYRDLHQLGFKTFGHVIDESFDTIENNQERLEKIIQVIIELCQYDLAKFARECYNTCKYNQALLSELGIKVRKEFPQQLREYIPQHIHE